VQTNTFAWGVNNPNPSASDQAVVNVSIRLLTDQPVNYWVVNGNHLLDGPAGTVNGTSVSTLVNVLWSWWDSGTLQFNLFTHSNGVVTAAYALDAFETTLTTDQEYTPCTAQQIANGMPHYMFIESGQPATTLATVTAIQNGLLAFVWAGETPASPQPPTALYRPFYNPGTGTCDTLVIYWGFFWNLGDAWTSAPRIPYVKIPSMVGCAATCVPLQLFAEATAQYGVNLYVNEYAGGPDHSATLDWPFLVDGWTSGTLTGAPL
jgi:hypothetical protein